MTARFDDLTTGRALAFPAPDRVLAAGSLADVIGVLDEVDLETAKGAWAHGFVSYDAAPAFDPSLTVHPPAADGPPLVWFGLSDRHPFQPQDLSFRTPPSAPWELEWSEGEHAGAVARIREHIAAGDVYQCNLTTRLRTPYASDPLLLYGVLAQAQRAAHNAYLDTGRFAVASASPELFLEWSGDRLRTKPMKGTARRSADPVTDARNARTLRASPKERAENLMIVDLIRNDLARVAAVGSVDVPRLLTLERYPTVWTMTSEVTARLRAGVGLAGVFGAMFPCGSITGAPKARSMQIIRDVEDGPRGVYCGAIGWVAPPSAPIRARFNVAIRTAVVDRATDTATYGAGGGITWDSSPAAEWAEVLAKSAILGTVSPRTLSARTLSENLT
ncbi:aminodeoxychorismate synthase component I [Actinoplanes sp. CA-142083]|uniref:aminodeoxychorismate synthase component I n=1 Tax=Actinoplanes sp. CA-142083 TaxID=3239903 RepID=UPI003D92CD1D